MTEIKVCKHCGTKWFYDHVYKVFESDTCNTSHRDAISKDRKYCASCIRGVKDTQENRIKFIESRPDIIRRLIEKKYSLHGVSEFAAMNLYKELIKVPNGEIHKNLESFYSEYTEYNIEYTEYLLDLCDEPL